MTRFSQCLGVLALVAGLAACAEPPADAPAGPAPMTFQVDSTRLGEAVQAADLGLRFRPPRAWAPLPEADLDTLRRALPDTAVVPRYVFLDREHGSLLSVATLALPDTLGFEAQAAHVARRLADAFPGDSLRRTAYLKDSLHVVQLLLQREGRVTFKLLLASAEGALVTFDYMVPRAYYPREIRAVESSIGSIQSIR